MRDGALEGEHGGEPVDVRRIGGGPRVGEEAEVVVAVHALRPATRVDHVDLGRHLVARSEPGPGHQRQDVVGVVVGERPRVTQGGLLQGVPDAIVGAGLREVVPGGRARGALLGDERVEDGGGTVDDRRIGEGVTEDDDSGAVAQGPHQLGADRAVRSGGAQPLTVVDEDVPLHRRGVREVGEVGGAFDERAEGVEVAVLLGQPGLTLHGGEGHRRPFDGNGGSVLPFLS